MGKLHNRPEMKDLQRRLRNETTEPEQLLWKKLQHRQLEGKKFRRQFAVGKFILDFYCPELKLGIEIDGDSHFEPSAVEYDLQRTAFIEGNGIRIVRFTNREVLENIEGVVETIRAQLQGPPLALSRYRPPHTPP